MTTRDDVCCDLGRASDAAIDARDALREGRSADYIDARIAVVRRATDRANAAYAVIRASDTTAAP